MNGLWLAGLLLAQVAGPQPSRAEVTAKAEAGLPVVTFEEALKQAAAKNTDWRQAQARLDQAHEAGNKAWAGYLPNLSVGGSYTRNSNEVLISLPGVAEEIPIQRYNQLAAQAQVTQALIAPTLWTGIKAAYQSEKVAELNTENLRREILFGVAQSYYGTVALKEAARVQQHLLDINRARAHDAEVRFKAGASPKIALLRAQIDLSKAEQDVQRATNAYLASKSGLAVLLGRDPNFDVVQPAEPTLESEVPEALQAKAGQERADPEAAQVATSLARTQHTGAWLSFLPTLGATGTYRWSNSSGFTGTATSWNIVLGLNWTLWDGGLRESNLRESSAKIVEADAALEGLRLKTRDQVRQALLELDSARANKVKAAQTLGLAKENLTLVHASVQAGAGTYLDEEDATAQLINAELALVSETLNASLAVLKVKRAVGTFR
jgi:outer membrane protein TolC